MSASVVYDHKKVLVSGFTFASILHEAAKSKNNTEGLLFGNITHSIKDKITDSDASGNHQELQIAISEIVPFEKSFSFYNHVGHVMDKDEIKRSSATFLGWYKVRRNTSNRISIRERAIIKNLIKICNMNEGLVFLLITPSCKENRSTLSFPYKFFLCERNEHPAGISVHVVNLGETGTHSEYRYQPSLMEPIHHSSNTQSRNQMSAMSHILSACQGNFMTADGSVCEVTHVHNMYQDILKAAKQFQSSILDTETQIQNYKKDIAELRKKLGNKNGVEDVVMKEEKDNSDDDKQDRRVNQPDDNDGTAGSKSNTDATSETDYLSEVEVSNSQEF